MFWLTVLRRCIECLAQRALEALGHAGLVNDLIFDLPCVWFFVSWHKPSPIGRRRMQSRVDLNEVAGYYQALGQFVDIFANVEEVLSIFISLYLSALAGMEPD